MLLQQGDQHTSAGGDGLQHGSVSRAGASGRRWLLVTQLLPLPGLPGLSPSLRLLHVSSSQVLQGRTGQAMQRDSACRVRGQPCTETRAASAAKAWLDHGQLSGRSGSHFPSHLPCHSPAAKQAGRRVCKTSRFCRCPLRQGPIGQAANRQHKRGHHAQVPSSWHRLWQLQRRSR